MAYFKERALPSGAKRGACAVLMPGAFGDELYSGEQDWFADLLATKRWEEARKELVLHLHYTGLRSTLSSSYIRRTIRRVIDAFPGGKSIHRRQTLPGWLTTFSTSFLSRS